VQSPSQADVPPAELDRALARLGYERFRPGQREAVERLLGERRLLLVAPTGGGKSLVYQLPACVLPGTTLVVSPLISLMQDQVVALEERGVSATFLAGTLPASELRARTAAAARGEVRLLYVAPERLAQPAFRALVRGLDCPLVAIDEAHCISEWGHDFRPEYMALGEVLAELPEARVLACTATATPVVRDEILERLGLPPETTQLVRGFARPNLSLRVAEVRSRRDREARIDAALAEALGGPGGGGGAAIVYAPTRRTAEEEAARLEGAGWRVAAYHAGLPGAERDRVHRAFADGALEGVVATNAFGMGIDRADVRAVLHWSPPASIEAYYQEVGRAGRDGRDALGLLLLAPNDPPLRRHLLELPVDGRPPDPEVVRHKWGLFLELLRWAEGGSCRHDAILRYFGDEEETLSGCGRCDVCRALDSGDDEGDPEAVTLVVRKALSGVARIHRRFGLRAAVKLLRGADDPRLARAGLDRTKTFGVLAERSEDWLQALLRRCVTAGWVDFEGGDRPVAVLTASGAAVMRGERPVRLRLPPEERRSGRRDPPAAAGRTVPGRAPAGPAGDEDRELGADERALFDALRRHRMEVARAEGVPPYVVASDRTLRDVARMRPTSLEELQRAHGIGETKAQRYGPGLLRVVAGPGSSASAGAPG